MADDRNLQESLQMLSDYLPEEIIELYRRTRFSKNAEFLREIQSFVRDDSVSFSVAEYATFLDQGTRYIKSDPFITPVVEDVNGMIEEIITNAFEKDINETINNAARSGGAKIS